MSQRVKKSLQIGVGLLVSAVCLWLAIQQAPISELGEVLQQVNYWWLAPAVLVNVVSVIGRGYRWRVLLADRGTVAEYTWAQAIGCLLTNVFPLRAGETGRVVVVSRQVGLPLVQVAASVVLERAADLVIVVGLLAAMLLIMDVPWPIALTGLALAAAVTGAWIGTIVLLVFGRQLTGLVEAVAGRLPERLARLGLTVWEQGLTALEPLRSRGVVARLAFWSVAVWVINIVGFWLCIEAVIPGAAPIEPTFALTMVAVGVSLPSSPGFIGVFQLVGQLALATPFPDRYTPATALAVAVLNHAIYYVSTSAMGLLGMARLGLSLRATRAASAVLDAAPTPAETRA